MHSSESSSSMKQIVIDGDNPFLPQEIIRNIFRRLPVKSLIRFQCVCKHWKNLFKTPSFIQDHLHDSNHQNPFLLFKGCGAYDKHFCLFDREMQIVEVQNTPRPDSLVGISIIGSSNGLLCFKLNNSSRSFLLWNPATREVRYVPRTVTFEPRHFYVGFGFSSMVNDYRIVRIYGLFKKVEVYSLNTRSWKEVEFANLDGVVLASNGFNTNGAIFWIGFKQGVGEDDDHLIVSFDIAMEVFTLIPLPTSVPKSYRNRLTVYKTKLAMLSHTVIQNCEYSLIDLWVIEEGTGASGERWRWIKKYTTSHYRDLLLPATIWRNEIVCDHFLLPGLSATIYEVKNGEQKLLYSISPPMKLRILLSADVAFIMVFSILWKALYLLATSTLKSLDPIS